jgi:hypothetical protein
LQQDYQRFLQLGSRRAPQTLYVHEQGYRSGTINTDAQGLRYSHRAGKRFSVAERAGAGRINLLVGGSTALGIGASSDEHTVASHLSLLTGETWLSLAGCGLNASQELLLFLTHQHRFGQLGHVVVLSGLNTLAQEALVEDTRRCPTTRSTPRPTWPFSIVSTRACKPPHRRAGSRCGSAAAGLAPRQAPQWPTLDALSPADKRLARAADSIGRTLRQWERLLADDHTSLTFILQPLLPWCRETLPAGEQAMLAGWRSNRRTSTACSVTATSQLHSAFFRRIRSQAEPVPCYDMNCMLSSSPVLPKTCSSIACTSTIKATTPWPR